MKDFLIMLVMTLITIANFYVFNLTREKYLETMQQLWKWEAYIKRWVKEAVNCHQQQD